MTIRFPICVAVTAGALMMTGCDREEEVETAPTPPATAPAATGDADTVDAETRVKFQTLMEQVTLHIRNREFQAAETGLGQMEQMRDQLDDAMRQQIDTTRAALTAARGAPAAPGTPAK